ncbi:MAG: hypothetical protein J5739_05865 [Lachnospiraceae bacterium]|nr:hypothetical protein [Lachnospiraceae bacterium]
MEKINEQIVVSEEVGDINHTLACGLACAGICVLAGGGFASGFAWVASEL